MSNKSKEIVSKKIEVDYSSPFWEEQVFLESLNDILHGLEMDLDKTKLLERLISSTDNYIDNITVRDTPLIGEIAFLYQILSKILTQEVIGKKLGTQEKNICIGMFIEGLIFFGLPRLPAIKATAEWLKISEAAARKNNESYRKNYPKDKVDKQLILGIRQSYIKRHIKKNPEFPRNHPRAKKAFEECKKLIELEPFAKSKPISK